VAQRLARAAYMRDYRARPRTEEELWEEFGQLVARHLMRAPQHLRDELLTLLQERSSVCGSAYERHMEAGL
jgi:hypothetical protein